MNIRRWVLLVIAAILVGLFELSFVSFLPEPWRGFRPILDVVVLCVILGRPRVAMVFGAVAGATLDLFPVEGTFAASIRLLLIAAALSLLAETVLTNRSVYATGVLIITARTIEYLWLLVAASVAHLVSSTAASIPPISAVFTTLVWDVVVMSIVFIAIAQFTRRFLVSAANDNRRYG